MPFNLWCIIIGLLLVIVALAGSVLKRLPLSCAMFYLAVGFALGPVGAGLMVLDPVEHGAILERITEIAVLVSLFSTGLKLRAPLAALRWWLPVRLAIGSMALTVGLIALAGVYGLGLPVGAAILLGAALAPTDPVLASDVQVTDPFDQDKLRFALTAEAGLNDCTAFPFAMLGLGLLGLHELGESGWRWVAVDLVWSAVGGTAVGAVLGTLVGRFVLHLRQQHKEAVGLDDFLSFGLVALSYGLAQVLSASGFLAVFVAGIALRRLERQASGDRPPEEVRAMAAAGLKEEAATHPEKAPAFMAEAVLTINEQMERICELTVVVLLGSMLYTARFHVATLWFVPLLFLVIRPLSVWLGLAGSRISKLQKRLTAWFGIRGIGSIFYLFYAIRHGLSADLVEPMTSLILTVVATSIFAHGVSVTPLMDLYQRRRKRHARKRQAALAAGAPSPAASS